MNEEIKNKAEELTDEDVGKVAGGNTTSIIDGDVVKDGPDKPAKCPSCLKTYTYVYKTKGKIPPCPYCGYERYDSTTPRRL
ncbi:hypothetical protein E4K67_23370 [Desulfosporosinus fructosivorans]|uniref:Uncharacterized protein n=1 Tax=Desulfosporosinus fructosivorans TaxID=2018669 RepID=A0A4Z0QZM3_9FIRM|nr:hypothetical protein [Desulfosporosinus fructosivorans]TGE35709.1 hypothetical protein E4K67_23370 [Desulfosporosinus fructosivorans]